jgi:hypothetical protein
MVAAILLLPPAEVVLVLSSAVANVFEATQILHVMAPLAMDQYQRLGLKATPCPSVVRLSSSPKGRKAKPHHDILSDSKRLALNI